MGNSGALNTYNYTDWEGYIYDRSDKNERAKSVN